MRCLIALVVVLLPVSVVAEDNGWICNPVASAGVMLDEGTMEWRSVTFRVGGPFVVTPDPKAAEQDRATYSVKDFGEAEPRAYCASGPDDQGWMYCESDFGITDYRFNMLALRYQSYYQIGYLAHPDYLDQPGNTPNIEIGECSPL